MSEKIEGMIAQAGVMTEKIGGMIAKPGVVVAQIAVMTWQDKIKNEFYERIGLK
jgi:hypothetical protein